MRFKMLLRFILIFFITGNILLAEGFTACTQNLENLGREKARKARGLPYSEPQFKQKTSLLVDRFVSAKCEVIAVQELLALDEKEAGNLLRILAEEIKNKTGQTFSFVTGKSNDYLLKMGILYRSDLFELSEKYSYYDYDLPKLTKYEKLRRFSRGPIRADLRHRLSGKKLTVITFHFKSASSKHGADPAGFNYEIDRLQMAAALNKIMTEIGNDRIVIAMGDRNSSEGQASAGVLSGQLEFENFIDQTCKLGPSGAPLCNRKVVTPAEFVSVIEDDPEVESLLPQLGKKFKLIDEVLVNAPYAKLAKLPNNNPFDYRSGIILPNKLASDHPLAWVKLVF